MTAKTTQSVIGTHNGKPRFNVDYKGLSDEHMNILLEAAAQHGITEKKDLLILLIESYKKSSRPGGARDSTKEKIHNTVQEQIKINLETDKTIEVGSGKNKRTVKYEQRAITQKWIMENAGANAKSIQEYLEEHKQEIDAHHKELGLNSDEDVRNYNRSTGKAADRVSKGLA